MSAPVIPFPATRAETVVVDGVRFKYESEDGRADRSELLAVLVCAAPILAEVKDPIGSAFRLHIIARIKDILARENRALGLL